MKLFTASFFLICIALIACIDSAPVESVKSQIRPEGYTVVIHGGAGNFDTESYSAEEEDAYLENLNTALLTAQSVLDTGGTALDAVEATISYMEDCPLFNAGKGAVFTAEGQNELDASIMNGKDLTCGSVTGIQNIKHPISAARKVMEESKHVFFSGAGATKFASEHGLEVVDSSYFFTQKSWDRYLQAKAANEKSAALPEAFKFGTVGCVIRDGKGNLAAGTSTGGMTWKKHGRIGDSPVIGAGTYADNNTCAISCTGHGEYFIRAAVAHDISARMAYGNESLKTAADAVVMDKLVDMGGSGGVIGVDYLGNPVMVFNSTGMFRGFVKQGEEPVVAMYGE
jgi:L-asparaginase / beta-aspartyl-peptidase